MTSSEVWDERAAAAYDSDSAQMFSPQVLNPAVDVLARLAEDGPALEFAIGTGRVALPLLERAVHVRVIVMFPSGGAPPGELRHHGTRCGTTRR